MHNLCEEHLHFQPLTPALNSACAVVITIQDLFCQSHSINFIGESTGYYGKWTYEIWKCSAMISELLCGRPKWLQNAQISEFYLKPKFLTYP